MTMRQTTNHRAPRTDVLPSYPLLEAGDLPGDDDWSLPAEFGLDDADPDADRLATLNLGHASDD